MDIFMFKIECLILWFMMFDDWFVYQVLWVIDRFVYMGGLLGCDVVWGVFCQDYV